jgi:hypothetical protein
LGVFGKRPQPNLHNNTYGRIYTGAGVFVLNKLIPDSVIGHECIYDDGFLFICSLCCITGFIIVLFPVQHTAESNLLYWKYPWNFAGQGLEGIETIKFYHCCYCCNGGSLLLFLLNNVSI